MPLLTFVAPKKDPRFFTPNRLGVDDNTYNSIIQSVQAQTPASAQLTDSANIDTDASIAENFYVILAGNRTMNAPTNPVNWKKIRYLLYQDNTGSRTLSWDASFRFSATLPSPTLTTTAGYMDIVEFVYNPISLYWDCLLIDKGFQPPP